MDLTAAVVGVRTAPDGTVVTAISVALGVDDAFDRAFDDQAFDDATEAELDSDTALDDVAVTRAELDADTALDGAAGVELNSLTVKSTHDSYVWSMDSAYQYHCSTQSLAVAHWLPISSGIVILKLVWLGLTPVAVDA